MRKTVGVLFNNWRFKLDIKALEQRVKELEKASEQSAGMHNINIGRLVEAQELLASIKQAQCCDVENVSIDAPEVSSDNAVCSEG